MDIKFVVNHKRIKPVAQINLKAKDIMQPYFEVEDLNILPLHPCVQYDSGNFSREDYKDVLLSIMSILLSKSEMPETMTHQSFDILSEGERCTRMVKIDLDAPGCCVILNPHINTTMYKRAILSSIGVIMNDSMLMIVVPDGYGNGIPATSPDAVHSLGLISAFETIVFRSQRWLGNDLGWMPAWPEYIRPSDNPLNDIGDLFENYAIMEEA